MPAEISDRDERVDLVAAALCDAGFFPEAWDFIDTERDAYRCETRDLLTKLDARVAARHADLVADLGGVRDTEAGLNAIVPTAPGPDGRERVGDER